MASSKDVFYVAGNTYIYRQICGARFKEGSKLLCSDVPNHENGYHKHNSYTLVDGQVYYQNPQNCQWFSALSQLSFFPEHNLTVVSYLYWHQHHTITTPKDLSKQQFYDIFWKDNSYKGYFPLPMKIAFDKMLLFMNDDSPYPTDISDEALADDPQNYERYKQLKEKYDI